jgi:hypothetical protein
MYLRFSIKIAKSVQNNKQSAGINCRYGIWGGGGVEKQKVMVMHYLTLVVVM